MYKRKRILLLSSSIILLCACLIAGATFALFTEEAIVTSHLKAGDLDATLIRKSGYYTVLNEEGVLQQYDLATTDVDFTEDTRENFFGDLGNQLIVPLSSFEVVYEIGNKGTTAFTYDVSIVPKDKTEPLSAQLWIEIGTVTVNADGSYTYNKLSDGWVNTGDYKLTDVNASCVKVGKTSGLLYTRVTFKDDTTVNGAFVNNDVQGRELNFDLVVTATQYTEIVKN